MKHSSTEARWRRLIVEQERSGLSVRDFAAERGLSAWSMYGWRRRLGVTRRRDGRRDADGVGPEREAGGLVAVEVVGGAPLHPEGSDRGFEVELSGGVRIHVPPGFEAEELSRLVAALRTSC